MKTALIVWIITSILAFAGWVTHVVVCLTAGLWGYLIAGAILFPIGVIHGIGYWFGFFH